MSAIVKACNFQNLVRNTGKECDVSMVATAMLIATPPGLKFTQANLLNPVPWLEGLINEVPNKRVYPLFGQQAPIRSLDNAAEGDILVTLDDGLKVFLRYGIYNRTFETTSGGLCYAKALQSLNKSGYGIIEIDQQGQMLCRNNGDGTYSGLICDFMYAPSPMLADFTSTPYKNRFQISYSPVEMVGNGVIFEGATQLLDMMGLIDTAIKAGITLNTATKIYFGVEAECADTDLVQLLGLPLATLSNFIVLNKATQAVVVPTGIAIVNGQLELTGVFTSGQTFIVKGSAPSIWLTNNVGGYDAQASFIEVLIP
jgi:hypothetical protein